MYAWDVLSEAVRDEVAAMLRAVSGTSVVLLHRDVHAVLRRAGVLQQVLTSAHGVVACEVMRDDLAQDDNDAPSSSSSNKTAVTWPRAQNVVLVLHPDVRHAHLLVSHILHYTRQHTTATPHVCFVPQKALLMEHVLDKELKLTHAFPQLTMRSLDADVLVLHAGDGSDKNGDAAAQQQQSSSSPVVLSMHLPRPFAQLRGDGDMAPLRWVARVLVKLQATLLGTFASVHGKGQRAVQVVQLLRRMQSEVGDALSADGGTAAGDGDGGEVHLLVLDRALDVVTPLLTQQTYEGILDDMYNVDCDAVDLPFAVTTSGSSGSAASVTHVTLDAARDGVFAQLRDLPFASVGATLYQQSMRVKERYDARRSLHGLKELKLFMQRLPELQEQHRLTALHTAVATELGKTVQSMAWRRRVQLERDMLRRRGNNNSSATDGEWLAHVDELIDRRAPLVSVLQLVCLHSLTSGVGMSLREYESVRESLMLAYGIPHVLAAFAALERAGLLLVAAATTSQQQQQQQHGTAYALLQRYFRLQPDTPSTTATASSNEEVSSVYGGHTPLLVRLIEDFAAAPHAWRAKTAPVHAALPAEYIVLPPDGDAASAQDGDEQARASSSSLSRHGAVTVVVCVVGGVTVSELTALRLLQRKMQQQQQHSQRGPRASPRLIVTTTDVCTGARLVHSLVDTEVL